MLYYILTYGLTTVGAFGVVAVVERATGSDRMEAFLGLHKRNPLLAAVLLVLFLSLAGIPPLVGFWAKFNLFAAVLGVSAGLVPLALVALAVAMSAVSLYYYLQVLKRVYVMPAVDETPDQGASSDAGGAGGDCGGGGGAGLLPGAAAGMDRRLLSGDVEFVGLSVTLATVTRYTATIWIGSAFGRRQARVKRALNRSHHKLSKIRSICKRWVPTYPIKYFQSGGYPFPCRLIIPMGDSSSSLPIIGANLGRLSRIIVKEHRCNSSERVRMRAEGLTGRN